MVRKRAFSGTDNQFFSKLEFLSLEERIGCCCFLKRENRLFVCFTYLIETPLLKDEFTVRLTFRGVFWFVPITLGPQALVFVCKHFTLGIGVPS